MVFDCLSSNLAMHDRYVMAWCIMRMGICRNGSSFSRPDMVSSQIREHTTQNRAWQRRGSSREQMNVIASTGEWIGMHGDAFNFYPFLRSPLLIHFQLLQSSQYLLPSY